MYSRDPSSHAIINMDDSYLMAIKARRSDRHLTKELKNEVDGLKCELTEIKSLLQQIINGKNYG